jgi:hypothetical protein
MDHRIAGCPISFANVLSILRPRLLVVARRDRPLRTHEALPR